LNAQDLVEKDEGKFLMKSNTRGKKRLTDRTRLLLTLELAIVLPAVSLMAFSVWNLHQIQRDKAIEAAIQRDFTYVLGFAEKKVWHKAAGILAPVRQEFPSCSSETNIIKPQLDRILAAHPEFQYVALYDKDSELLVWRFQQRFDADETWHKRLTYIMTMTDKWLPFEAPGMVHKLRVASEKDEMPFGFEGGWMDRDDDHYYYNFGYFIPAEAPHGDVSLGLVGFDPEYLHNSLFPTVITDVLSSKNTALRSDANPPAMMIRPSKSYTPWVTSSGWDGGKPEMERPLANVFQGMVLGIKYPGTTIDAIGAKFLRYNYIVLGALSLLMAGGVYMAYRNMSREMNLARLKSDFVANVSHELRTPLALIRLYAETLELGRLTAKEKYQEYFRIIREESERLSALINNILDFSRIEAGRKEYEFKETNLGELVRTTLEAYRFQIEQNGFAFEENIASDIPPVNVDREAIARSLLNLVNNALKYSKDHKYIGVSLYRANGSVKLEVQDRGIGIAPAEQEKIFEKFYRCGDPLVHNTKGSGLGLSLVRHIAQAHGGNVSVESAPQKGSKFTIALPINLPLREGHATA
jgi:signal transduction histidine kinase